jgi:hypothetical protein
MGSFSWMRADMTTQRANLTMGDAYKILVPQEFGGGYIKDRYWDYGYVNKDGKSVYVDGNGNRYPLTKEHDLYGILAMWNKSDMSMKDILEYIDTCEQDLRCEGIDIGCYPWQINNSKYPLKLVSARYKGTYEECDMVSYGDPEQGFCKTYWKDYTDRYYKCREMMEER